MEKYRFAIEWFKNIKNKTETSFIIFDILIFYLSISPDLFKKSIGFPKFIHNISDNDLKIIVNAIKTLFFHHDKTWIKKHGGESFDVPMRFHDGVKIC